MKVISITNQKGGVGKSTTAHALGAGLSKKGFNVLLIDLDPQGNITYTTGADNTAYTSYGVLTKRASITEAIQETTSPKLHIVPAGRDLTRLDLELNITGKEYRLKEALEPLKGYDYIVIDTPPALSLLTVNALTASESVIIPAQADIYSLQGIGQLHETAETIRKYCNPSLKINGILLTRHSTRTILSRDMSELIEATAKQIKTFTFKGVIRECIALKEAQATQQDIFTYAPKSNASKDYTAFINEYLKRSVNNG